MMSFKKKDGVQVSEEGVEIGFRGRFLYYRDAKGRELKFNATSADPPLKLMALFARPAKWSDGSNVSAKEREEVSRNMQEACSNVSVHVYFED